MSPTLDLRLADHHDVSALAKRYAETGAVRIEKLFPDNLAERIATVLETATPWHVVHSDAQGAHKYHAPEEWAAMDPQLRNKTLQDTLIQARDGFAYLYSCYPMLDAFLTGRDPGWPLHAMMEYLNSDEMLDFVKAVTNEPKARKLDAQATLYGRGHFLNRHDDTGTMAERRAAYVMGFSRDWDINWGGQLLFLDENHEPEQGFNPSFNTLTLFKVPRQHIVTQVTNFAGRGRYAITGWLRDD